MITPAASSTASFSAGLQFLTRPRLRLAPPVAFLFPSRRFPISLLRFPARPFPRCPVVGITSTPVIDLATGTLYVLARSGSRVIFLGGDRYAQHLHGLAITTGKEKCEGPVEIYASVVGTDEGSSGSNVEFDPLRGNHRATLRLVNGVIYLTWGSSCDVSPYRGGSWRMTLER